jgi:hypothetical protein
MFRQVDWGNKIIELLVVITGVTIAFSLNNWNEQRKADQLQNNYLQSMQEELEIDISELKDLIRRDSIGNVGLETLLSASYRDPATINRDSMNLAIENMGNLVTFQGQSITYRSLLSSGRLDAIEDLDLRYEIINHYHKSYNQIHEIEGYYRESYDEFVIPFFMEHIVLTEAVSVSPDVIGKPDFLKSLAYHYNFLIQKANANKLALSSAKQLNERLKTELSAK